MLHVVLIEPEIPWNTGNIGRTCLGAGAKLHLVGRLGFHLDDQQVQRAGLDYWEKVNPVQHGTWEKFLESLPKDAPLFFLSTKGQKAYWDAAYPDGSHLIFGKETAGFPPHFYDLYKERLYKIPQQEEDIRSLNLSTAVGIVLFEAVRQRQKSL
jgi:tRNA (cytidine/uridine-2'-O-)-methyltransferase